MTKEAGNSEQIYHVMVRPKDQKGAVPAAVFVIAEKIPVNGGQGYYRVATGRTKEEVKMGKGSFFSLEISEIRQRRRHKLQPGL